MVNLLRTLMEGISGHPIQDYFIQHTQRMVDDGYADSSLWMRNEWEELKSFIESEIHRDFNGRNIDLQKLFRHLDDYEERSLVVNLSLYDRQAHYEIRIDYTDPDEDPDILIFSVPFSTDGMEIGNAEGGYDPDEDQ